MNLFQKTNKNMFSLFGTKYIDADKGGYFCHDALNTTYLLIKNECS